MDDSTVTPEQKAADTASDRGTLSKEEALAILDSAQHVVDRAMRRQVIPIGLMALLLPLVGGGLWYLGAELESRVFLVLGPVLAGPGLFVALVFPLAFLLHRAEPARYRRCFAELRHAPDSVVEASMIVEGDTREEDEADVTTKRYFLTLKTTNGSHKLNVSRQDRNALRRALERLIGCKVADGSQA